MSEVLPASYYYFFWLVEPALSVAGGVYAIFRPETYVVDLLPSGIERFTQIVGNTLRGRQLVSQLGSCKLLVTYAAPFIGQRVHEAALYCFLVLAMNSFSLLPVFRRQTPELQEKLTAALLLPLLIGDFVHIGLTLLSLPDNLAFEPWRWTQLIHGNVNITLVLVAVRTLWFLGVGRLSPQAEAPKRKLRPRKSNKAE